MKHHFTEAILSFLVACTLIVGCTIPGFAARFPDGWTDEEKESYCSGIPILYNGDYLAFDTAQPQLIDGRVMLPFREILGYMNASVEYDEMTHEISATKGDTTVQFFINSPVVVVTRADGSKDGITMDVTPVIDNGYTLVPVRFLAEAFEISVSWSEWNPTVVLVDFDAYLVHLQQRSSDFYEFLSMPLDLPDPYSSISNLSFSSSTEEDSTGEMVTSGFDINMGTQSKYDGNIMASENVIDVDIKNANRIFDLLENETIDTTKLKGITFDFRSGGGAWYIKTNLLSKLAEAMPDNRKLSTLVALLKDEIWLKIDFKELFEDSGAPSEMNDWISSYLKDGADALRGKSSLDLLRETYSKRSLSYWQADNLDALFQKAYALCDNSHFKLTKTTTDTYEVSYTMSPEDYKEHFYPDSEYHKETIQIRAQFTVTNDHVIRAIQTFEYIDDDGPDFSYSVWGKVYLKLDFSQQPDENEPSQSHTKINGIYRLESDPEFEGYHQTTNTTFTIETDKANTSPEETLSLPKSSINYIDLLNTFN